MEGVRLKLAFPARPERSGAAEGTGNRQRGAAAPAPPYLRAQRRHDGAAAGADAEAAVGPPEGQSPGELPEAGQGAHRAVLGRLLRHGRHGPPPPFELPSRRPPRGGAPRRHL